MIARRTTFCALTVGLCSAGLAWIGVAAPGDRVSPTQLVEEQPYAVAVAFDRARLDLDFDQESRYLLIIGSLGDGHATRTVTLSSESISETSLLSAKPLAPLAKRRKSRGSTATFSTPAEEESPDAGKSRTRRHFHLHVTDGSLDDARHYVRVVGELVGEGRKVQVYLDRQQSQKELSAGLVEDIVQLLDEKLLPRFRRQVGGFRDVDGDGKFTVLLSPWLDKLQGGKTSLGGFVRESDFRTDIEAPFSNRCDMMYLNSNLQPGAHLQTLLAHEFMHAVSFSARLPSKEHPAGLPDEEDWLNEAIAHLSENLNGDGWSNLDYRISRYLSRPQEYPLVVDDYYHAGLWRNHGCRGATYLFLRWCVDEFGVGVLNQLIHAPARGRDNLQHATGVPFDELFRRWTIALYQSNRHTGADADEQSSVNDDGGFSGYRSLNLRGSIGEWGLAGPRPVNWLVSETACEVNLAGSAAAFVQLDAPPEGGRRRIYVSGQFGTDLQVTLLKLPSDVPHIKHTARWTYGGRAEMADCRFQIDFATAEAAGLKVEHVSFCRNRGETRETVCFTGRTLEKCRSGSVDSANQMRFEFPLPAQEGKWLATIAAHDDRGRRVSAFIDIPAAKQRAATRVAAGQRAAGAGTRR